MRTTRKGPVMKLPEAMGGPTKTPFANFSPFVDPSGKLNFDGKAVLHAQGVDFSNGNSYKINMEEFELLEELGKGQYGTVQKVFHKPTNVTMAMKEIRLELDEAKLNQILMELDILHQSRSSYIVEFYGAFFIESCVYYCMEYMDAGSLDKLYGGGIPEDVLAKITFAMVKGLKFLKDSLNIIHRDVKPTNVLVNMEGEVKLCDFGVSGQLIQSRAKTNIGCQSYMAPERIIQGDASTYTVQSDVWSLGLSMLELGTGKYPYPVPDKNERVGLFAQLNAIVQGDPPSLPKDNFSAECHDFVAKCLNKNPQNRLTYAQLLEHPFLKKYEDVDVDMKAWAKQAYASRKDLLRQS
ncbi:kinase-like protein [Rhizophagus irregularis]|uniref:mitogen-activated protein kinase kinase n=1 Tax=Rhizophagus irregularis TaxID=588596 RepID=A0A1C9IHJ5_9GLOM|nr:Ste7 [Rhizophagus irregularis]PKY39088.1 kinase-like protein [Rhizophagus irregularis]